ncbi:hypothetical protein BZA05DRAFT_411782 [Tricharina praecox]|uniref:uncharacterized protein n=1 Tax=Tricharina praecox TaxID=43433 RepID=UPI0022201419|nr:uncharacterized protein BZA05DRAFT_411782 [Tricharina praecox]KAI5842755.1 hypothetical protein BZA05DRAFT_411782 [Tricharina praecox]
MGVCSFFAFLFFVVCGFIYAVLRAVGSGGAGVIWGDCYRRTTFAGRGWGEDAACGVGLVRGGEFSTFGCFLFFSFFSCTCSVLLSSLYHTVLDAFVYA